MYNLSIIPHYNSSDFHPYSIDERYGKGYAKEKWHGAMITRFPTSTVSIEKESFDLETVLCVSSRDVVVF